MLHNSIITGDQINKELFTLPKNIHEYSNIPKPWKYKNWLIWPRTILYNIDVSNCDDAPEGICYKNRTIKECIGECSSRDCGAGMYIMFKNGDSICAPLRTSIHANLSPLYRLRQQEYYDLDPNEVDVSVFVNTNMYSYPPNYANTVFFRDIVTIDLHVNKELLALDTSDVIVGGAQTPLTVGKNKNSRVLLLSARHIVGDINQNHPIVYGDKIVILVAGTSYIAKVDLIKGKPILVWVEALSMIEDDNTNFTLLPVDPKKKLFRYFYHKLWRERFLR